MQTSQEIVSLVTAKVPGFRADKTCDTFKSGNPAAAVRGVVVTLIATRAVLDRAVQLGANLVITHEPTFYQDERLAEIAGDPVYESKRAFIEAHGLIVWRCHDTLHWQKPDVILAGIMRKLGWQDQQSADRQELFDFNPLTLQQLAVMVKHRLAISAVRVTGDPAMAVRRVAVSVGCNSWDNQRKLMREPGVDVLVCGEVREWETCEYARDTAATRRPQGLIVLGHCNSEEAGMAYFAESLAEQLPGTPVHFVPAGDPFWNG